MRYFFLLIVCAHLVGCHEPKADSKYVLWYQQPAEHFEESLVMGNGKVGATIFGGVNSDKIYLNDATLWAGEPVDPNMNPDAYQFIPSIREALENEDYRKADRLNQKIQGKFSESFAPLGTMFIDFEHQEDQVNYKRKLDIERAVSTVEYEVNQVKFTREYFVSNPDKVLMIRLRSDKKEKLNFKVRFSSKLKYTINIEDEELHADGYAPYHAEPGYRSNIEEPVLFDEKRGTRFSTYFKIKNTDGELKVSDSTLSLSGATEAVIYVSVATSFNGFDKDPAQNGLNNQLIATKQLDNAYAKEYLDIRSSHLNDFQGFFDRVKLDLGLSTAPNLPTDERLKRYAGGEEDKGLEELYFQYGRYLLISSSRTLGVPANLQGIWNPYMRPPWSSNYTMNINVEENYWLAENTNLSEMHKPFLGFINNLSQTGAITAKTFYGVDKGWAACHNSDIWAMSNPVGDFGKGHPVWACWNMSGAWTVTHLWDHYLYNQDQEFLKNEAYPLMKGAAEFCLNWLIEDGNGHLVTSPSTSPENIYQATDGYKGATLYGSTSDMSMIRECFLQVIRASEELNTDVEFRNELKQALEKLYPYQIGRDGSLQEWYHDWEDADPKHRHQSHLFGLYPGRHLSPTATPKLAQACRKALEIKGEKSTGWSQGWRINLWARLLDGNKAYKMFRQLLNYVDPSGLATDYGGGGGTYPNLLDAHPPFQIDGNFGGSAGVVEMLLQSDENEILILPALPDAWESGSVKGLCARGGFELDIEWKDGHLQNLSVFSKAGKNCLLKYNDKSVDFATEKDEKYVLSGDLIRK